MSKQEPTEACAACLVGIVAIPLLIVVTAGMVLLDGVLVRILWDWFIVTTFGAAPLSLAQAIGLSVFVSYMLIPSFSDDSGTTKHVVRYLSKTAIIMLIAFVVHQYI